MTKFRMSDNDLQREKRRHLGIKREGTFCPDEGHLLADCLLYSPFRKVFFSKIKQDSQENLKTIIIDLFRSNDLLKLTVLPSFLEDPLLERYITVTFNQAQGAEYDLTLLNCNA